MVHDLSGTGPALSAHFGHFVTRHFRHSVAVLRQRGIRLHPARSLPNMPPVTGRTLFDADNREAKMTLSAKVGYLAACLAFVFVGAITMGLI